MTMSPRRVVRRHHAHLTGEEVQLHLWQVFELDLPEEDAARR